MSDHDHCTTVNCRWHSRRVLPFMLVTDFTFWSRISFATDVENSDNRAAVSISKMSFRFLSVQLGWYFGDVKHKILLLIHFQIGWLSYWLVDNKVRKEREHGCGESICYTTKQTIVCVCFCFPWRCIEHGLERKGEERAGLEIPE